MEAKEEFLEKMREEQAAVRAARIEEARLKEEYARRRLEMKVYSFPHPLLEFLGPTTYQMLMHYGWGISGESLV